MRRSCRTITPFVRMATPPFMSDGTAAGTIDITGDYDASGPPFAASVLGAARADRGVLAICDPRLVDKPYGRRIWQSLPPMKRTREEDEAVGLLQGLLWKRER